MFLQIVVHIVVLFKNLEFDSSIGKEISSRCCVEIESFFSHRRGQTNFFCIITEKARESFLCLGIHLNPARLMRTHFVEDRSRLDTCVIVFDSLAICVSFFHGVLGLVQWHRYFAACFSKYVLNSAPILREIRFARRLSNCYSRCIRNNNENKGLVGMLKRFVDDTHWRIPVFPYIWSWVVFVIDGLSLCSICWYTIETSIKLRINSHDYW